MVVIIGFDLEIMISMLQIFSFRLKKLWPSVKSVFWKLVVVLNGCCSVYWLSGPARLDNSSVVFL